MKIIQSGEIFQLSNLTATPKTLPIGNYLLKQDPNGNFYLQKKEPFKLPSKIYGDHSQIERWLTSYEHNSEKNMGIILSGLKGTGKTITCQMLCQKAKRPVIIINEPYRGSNFIDFITNPCFKDSIVFVDEFEKIYDSNRYGDNGRSPLDFLTIMDGNYNTRLMFLLTVNSMTIDEHMVNRPGRIKYRKHYENLPVEIVDEVIDDLLENKEHAQSVHKFFETVGTVTYDLLVSLIKDMNLFKEDAIECGKHFNLKVETHTYDVTEIRDGKSFACEAVNYNPQAKKFFISRLTWFQGTEEKNYEDEEEDTVTIAIDECDIKRVGLDRITIVTPQKHMFKLTKKTFPYYVL